ncbi:DUF917 domain-containing protein [Candidatus Bathyarchaeota archaeon]|nr:DUF917 domain-containing protein [Candidatus Bathyarchaeota archaeon]
MVRELSREELLDFIYGADIYGTGGGGSRSWAIQQLREAEGYGFRLIDVDEVPEDAVVACPYGVGGGVREEIRRRLSGLPRLKRREVVSLGVEAFERFLERKLYGFVAGELGAGNTFLAMYMAALTGRYIIDGDSVGRSVPEVEHSTFNLCDVSITPYVVVSPFGDVLIVTRVLNDSRAEDIDRYMAVASGGGVTVIDHPIEGRRLRGVIVEGTISKSIEVGRALREAREKGGDPVEAVVEATGGAVIFRGVVEEFRREGREGFLWGETHIRGVGEYADRRMRIWFKNENLISWLDDKPYVTCPDLITLLDPETGYALSNFTDDIKPGREVAVIGIKAPEIWRTQRGLELLSPRYFGFDIDYRPLEELVSEA